MYKPASAKVSLGQQIRLNSGADGHSPDERESLLASNLTRNWCGFVMLPVFLPVNLPQGLGHMTIKNSKIAFIRARWHSDIVDQAYEGFKAQAAALGFDADNIEVLDAPGAFEMPLIAKMLGQAKTFDAIVAAAWVVDGGVYRHDFVASAVVDGLMQAQMDTGVPVFSISLTPHQYQETEFHNETYIKHMYKKGQEAAGAVALQLETLAKLRG